MRMLQNTSELCPVRSLGRRYEQALMLQRIKRLVKMQSSRAQRVTMKGPARAVLQQHDTLCFTRAGHARCQSGRNDLRCGSATDDENVFTKSGEGTIHRPNSHLAKSRCRWGKS